MNASFSMSRRSALQGLAALSCVPFARPLLAADAQVQTRTAALPGNSVYQLRPHLIDQNGSLFAWDSLRGQPALLSMFYSSCDMVCPMIFETIQQTLVALSAAQRERVRVLMLSFDPERDTVAQLKKTAEAHRCDERWTLVRCDAATARKVAAVLGIQYRRLPSGEFNHSSTIEMLDAQGRIAAKSGQLGSADPALVKALRAQLV